jgi:uncharacterized membrane protein (UPF0127 family)
MREVAISNQARPLSQPIIARFCNSFFCRLRGLMFTRPIAPGVGLLLVEDRDSRLDAAIHMFFVDYDLAIIWINQQKIVTDTCLARRWRPFYMPKKPARYILEVHPEHLSAFQSGDSVHFTDV